ncbi:hypothetical protein ACIA8K_34660 [Catenuloplanes sp. NPDC051500]|uniref:hypothetical protein n=1 Tax=Catenuloplanes sp. NPDC051500 TaxID=3363959 RepID=UPI0037A69597
MGLDESRDVLWDAPEDGVPPVVGRRDPVTRKPMMVYDTRGEIGETSDPAIVDHYQTDDGVDVSVSF